MDSKLGGADSGTGTTADQGRDTSSAGPSTSRSEEVGEALRGDSWGERESTAAQDWSHQHMLVVATVVRCDQRAHTRAACLWLVCVALFTWDGAGLPVVRVEESGT